MTTWLDLVETRVAFRNGHKMTNLTKIDGVRDATTDEIEALYEHLLGVKYTSNLKENSTSPYISIIVLVISLAALFFMIFQLASLDTWMISNTQLLCILAFIFIVIPAIITLKQSYGEDRLKLRFKYRKKTECKVVDCIAFNYEIAPFIFGLCKLGDNTIFLRLKDKNGNEIPELFLPEGEMYTNKLEYICCGTPGICYNMPVKLFIFDNNDYYVISEAALYHKYNDDAIKQIDDTADKIIKKGEYKV